MGYDMELDIDDLLEKREAKARKEEHPEHPEHPEEEYHPETTDSDLYSDLDTEFIAAKSPPRAVAPANPPKRSKWTNIGIPAQRPEGIVITIDPRIAQIQTVNVSVQERATSKSYAKMQLLSERKRKMSETAMVTEYAGLLENDTFEFVNLPIGRKPIPCKMIYELQKAWSKEGGQYLREKCQLVAK